MIDNFGSHFFDEAGFGEFAIHDKEKAKVSIRRYIETGIQPYIVCEVAGQTAGIASYYLDDDWTVKPMAFMGMFYVLPVFRRSHVARAMVMMLEQLASGDGACVLFVTIAPTSRSGALLANVFRRAGYQPMGGAFTRKL